MNRLEQITRTSATKSWRVKTAGSAAIVAGFCSTIGAFDMHLMLNGSPISPALLPLVMVAGIGTILAGLLFNRGMSGAAAASIWLTMGLGFGGAVWNTYVFENIGVFPINIAAVLCSLAAFSIAPFAWMEIRQVRRNSYYAAVA